ncbi:hypothetical protein GCM10025877_31400 [Agromyces mangrovi Wang et al. 2018]|nr:hypothetical protein GCM10025877_31400 [Agromyces mangrovi]
MRDVLERIALGDGAAADARVVGVVRVVGAALRHVEDEFAAGSEGLDQPSPFVASSDAVGMPNRAAIVEAVSPSTTV